jgi:glycosyltransferase involved in cell wall biosynthesis
MKIAILSDSPFIPTGYRNQALQLAQYLQSQGHEIHYMANAFAGMTLNSATLFDGTICNFKIYGELMQSYFRNTMSEILKTNMIDRFIILLDTFMLYGNDGWFCGIDTAPAKTFFWYPTDGGGGMPIGCANILKKVNVPVAMSQFGQKQVKDYHQLNTLYIPHGVNTDLFFKMNDEQRMLLRKKYGLTDKFVIGVVARNQPRKFLDRTLKAMTIIKDKIPNAILFMHMDPNDPAQGQWGIKSLIKKFNLENRVIFSGMD